MLSPNKGQLSTGTALLSHNEEQLSTGTALLSPNEEQLSTGEHRGVGDWVGVGGANRLGDDEVDLLEAFQFQAL